MFGREYSSYPEILLSSFSQMHDSYGKVAKKKQIKNNFFQSIYLNIFGIPEIGFQVRNMYFEKIIEEKIKKKTIKKVLDAGSGIGSYSFWLSRYFEGASVYGGDIDEKKIKFCNEFSKKKKLTNVEFGYFDVTRNSRTKDKYDLIVNIDVLEHIKDYKKVLKNLSSLISKGGYLYLHAPQPNQKRIFKQFKKWEHEDHLHEGYTPDELVGELKNLGFKIVNKRETFGFFGKLAWELNHLSFKKGFLVTGILFPILYVIASIDLLFNNSDGLGTAILARKK